MRVLVACEFSGIVRDAFREAGHDAVSCDLIPSERPGPHVIGDAVELAYHHEWDLLIAHPPCTFLSRVGARWRNVPGREEATLEAAAFVQALYDAPVERVAVENPIGRLNQLWRYPDQTIEPHEFGEPYRKRTCLWLRGLPPLLATLHVSDPAYFIDSYPGGRTPGFDYRSTRGKARSAGDRSRTFPGIAQAMAAQWA